MVPVHSCRQAPGLHTSVPCTIQPHVACAACAAWPALVWSGAQVPDGVCLSGEAQDLLGHLLQPDAVQRYSLAQLMRHPWFQERLPEGERSGGWSAGRGALGCQSSPRHSSSEHSAASAGKGLRAPASSSSCMAWHVLVLRLR